MTNIWPLLLQLGIRGPRASESAERERERVGSCDSYSSLQRIITNKTN